MQSSESDRSESNRPETAPRALRRAGVRVRGRTLAVTVGALVIAVVVGVVGFGSLASADDTSGTGTSDSSAAPPHSLPQLTADQKTCLKNALGDLMPTPGSTPAMPTPDQIKNGLTKLKDAMTTCGVTLPADHHFGGTAGFPGLTADQKTCLKNALGDLMPTPGSTPAMPTPDQIKNGLTKLKDAMTTCGVTLPGGTRTI